MLAFLNKLDKGIEVIQTVVCCILMFAIMWLTFFMVFFRYVLNNSIVWAEEVLRYLMIWVVLVGAGLTTREDQHVCMDGLQSVLERWPKLRAVHYVITRLIVFVFMLLMISPSLGLIQKTGNSTATSLVWLPKKAVYISFICGIISVNLSLLSQVPRKVYAILHNLDEDETMHEARERAAEMDRMLAEEAAEGLIPDDVAADEEVQKT
ncbi:MAG: TRAP transporter small permease [Oscillospiraceae bacterium]|nr:TRAP transporter small permease [Oscillospiraceae bacterium]